MGSSPLECEVSPCGQAGQGTEIPFPLGDRPRHCPSAHEDVVRKRGVSSTHCAHGSPHTDGDSPFVYGARFQTVARRPPGAGRGHHGEFKSTLF
ncbi:hypothetical protein TNCV_490511 [Trichonephila clavipes]|nr:hypothetical protein TNCV_490511 [Trichonephila clavipes]